MRSTRRTTFYYGARTRRDLCFEKELYALSESLPNFRYIPALSEADGDEDQTLWQGSLTSTSFLHREVAGISAAIGNGVVGAENAAPARYFTDLRAQIDAFHIAGNSWDARVDARARVVNTITSADGSTSSSMSEGTCAMPQKSVELDPGTRSTTSTSPVPAYSRASPARSATPA